jgi:5'-AMP-activated protein kinase catalytic alpha subunit
MEYCERRELFDYIVKLGKIGEKEACRIFQQIINGIEYLHNQNIIHRDLNKGKVTGLE